MKIVHIVQHYMQGHTYQENYLPAAMAKLGHDVTIISGVDNPDFFKEPQHKSGDKIRDKGVTVRYTKIGYKRFYTPVQNLYELLCEEKPEFVFVHGFILTRSPQLLRYAHQNPECVFAADTHETYLLAYNACFTDTMRDRIRHFVYFKCVYQLWRRTVERRYCSVFYVTPPRKTFAMREFGFSEHILKPLWMGADFQTLPYEQKPALRGAMRDKYGIPADANIMILAGKLDAKKRPVELAEAFRRLDNANWWLMYVGSLEADIRERIEQAAGETEQIIYTGFLSGNEVLEHIAASDLAVYPGAHSVLWEQTVCLGIPAIFYEEHSGDAAHLSDRNALFIHHGDAEEILDRLQKLCADKALLIQMGKRARQYAESNLSYDKTAEKALRDCGF